MQGGGDFSKQVLPSRKQYATKRHLNALFVCVDKDHQGKGVGASLVVFAEQQADSLGIPLLFDTDMPAYAELYQRLGCELYNTVTADNGVTRYSLRYPKSP